MSDSDLGAVTAELRNIAGDIGEIKHSLKNVQHSQTVAGERLTRIEVKQENAKEAVDRAFAVLKNLEERVQKVELEQPLTKLVRDQAIKAVLGIVAVLAPMLAVQVWSTLKTAERPVMVIDKEVVERWKSLNQKE